MTVSPQQYVYVRQCYLFTFMPIAGTIGKNDSKSLAICLCQAILFIYFLCQLG